MAEEKKDKKEVLGKLRWDATCQLKIMRHYRDGKYLGTKNAIKPISTNPNNQKDAPPQ